MARHVIRDAIISKRSLTARSAGMIRRFSPHLLGRAADGREVVIGYQYAGDRLGGLPAGGDWCCLQLDALDDVEANADKWQPGTGQAPRNHLVSLDIWIT